jgi:hypothetical protein
MKTAAAVVTAAAVAALVICGLMQPAAALCSAAIKQRANYFPRATHNAQRCNAQRCNAAMCCASMEPVKTIGQSRELSTQMSFYDDLRDRDGKNLVI